VWGLLLALAAVGHCLSWILISRSMVVLPVALAGLLLLAQPIVAYVLDVLVLDLSPSPRQWAGLAVSLAGIFVAGMKSRQAGAAQEA
jgi:drug/metabolite transporter (DMT)-like permease